MTRQNLETAMLPSKFKLEQIDRWIWRLGHEGRVVTIDTKTRMWREGVWTEIVVSSWESSYEGKGWMQALVDDVVDYLEGKVKK